MTGLEIPMWLVLLALAAVITLLGLPWECYWATSHRRGRRRLVEKHGVLTRMHLASCLQEVLERPAARKRSGKEKRP